MQLSDRTITMQMVAREAGVSVGTVSKVVNGGPCNGELASRVREAIRILGYQPNPYARAMRSHRTHCLGILIDQKYCSNTIWLQDLLFQLTESAARFAYQIHTRIMDVNGSPLNKIAIRRGELNREILEKEAEIAKHEKTILDTRT